MKEKIHYATHAPEMLGYLETFEWGESIHIIDWEAHKKDILSLPQGRKFPVSKTLFNWIPKKSRLHSRTPPKHPHPYCSSCKTSEESHDHVFQCGHHFSRSVQIKSLEIIRARGKKRKMYPLMMSIILRNIHAWMRQTPLDMTKKILVHNTLHQKLDKVIRKKNEIGWGHALRGRFSKEWGKFQDIVDKAEKRSPRPGTMVNLICILWEKMTNMRKARNGVQHGITKEERRNRANKKHIPISTVIIPYSTFGHITL